MKAVVGLGNVGRKYEKNRHNAGFMFVDEFKQKWKGRDLTFLKPQTMMNNSGKEVSELLSYYKISPDGLYVAFDDLDLRLGEYKIQFGVGPKVHNGVSSIEEHLKTHEFWRIRIGIDNRDPENRILGEKYVLQDFAADELKIVNDVIKKAVEEVKENL